MDDQMNDFDKLSSRIRDIKCTMLTTVSPDGSLHSRPMVTIDMSAYDFQTEGTLWFFSRKNSLKNIDIQNDQHVNLAFSDSNKERYVSVCGRAFISHEKVKMQELWNPELKTWFPEGPSDPELTLIGIRVESAELWDAPPSKVVQLAGFMKSAVTGRPFEQKSHRQHIDLRH